MTEFTRLTVSGSARRAELVVPQDEPIGGLLPRLMELLQEPTGPAARPLTLVRATGEQIDAGLSAAQQRILDGEQLRLIRADEAPPPPEVADVTDVVGDTYADRAGSWSSTARYATAAIAIGATVGAAGLLWPMSTTVGALVLAVLVAAAILTGRLGRRWPAIAFTAAAAGASIGMVRSGLPASATDLGRLGTAAVAVAVLWAILGLGFGGGLRNRSAAPAAVLGAVLAAFPVVLVALGLQPDRALVLVAVAAVVGCGLLPWVALSGSGLTGLDDRVVTGNPGDRGMVLHTVNEAYRSLSWASFAVALPLAVAPAVLVSSADRWTFICGLVVLLITALRTRVFPLVLQRLPLWLAVLAGAITAALAHRTTLGTAGTAAVLVLLAALVAVGAGLGLADHQRARLRRLGNLLEALAVIALPILVLGAFGVYSDLVGAFR